jgi:chromosome partitioning protein
LLDFDPQTSLTFSFITPDAWEAQFASSKTMKSWFESLDSGGAAIPLSSLIHSPIRVKQILAGKGSLDIVCSHLGLINVDLELATKLGGANIAQAKKNFISIHRRLANGLLPMVQEEKYDVVLIDCPPNFNVVTKTAIVASDYLLVPARPDYLSTLGIDYLIRNVNQLVKDYNDYAEVDQGEKIEKISPKVLGARPRNSHLTLDK